MLVKIDTAASEPLYAQIAARLRHAIGSGDLAPGERIPPARELAEALGVNMHTVLRAYAVLRDEGLVEMRRKRGVVVLPGGSGRARLVDLAHQVRAEAVRQGLAMSDVLRLMQEVT
jgi:GntR family transcriptional regulator